jgi:hypothetical protein
MNDASVKPRIERYNSRMDTETIVTAIDEEIDRLQKARSLLTGHTAPLQRGRPSAAVGR